LAPSLLACLRESSFRHKRPILLHAHRQEKQDQAIRWYRESLRLSNTFRPALGELAATLLRAQKNLAEAEQELRLAIQRDPEYHAAHLALAEILDHTGNVAGARTHFQKASESHDPEITSAALLGLGRLQQRRR
jgi:tetratricopeptide (TPR) repeat protein